jgi:periplasmic divalent cation tolerance protein
MPKREREIIWVVTGTNSAREAERIGRAVLKKRLAACFSLIPRLKSVYFWPPQSGKLESGRGPLLTLETLEKNYGKISQLVKKQHSDRVPLIGKWEIEDVSPEFYRWLQGEIK